MNCDFVQPRDTSLGKQVSDAMVQVGELVGRITSGLPDKNRQAIAAALQGGARVGLELTTDKASQPLVRLILIEREGTRRVLATVATGGAGGPEPLAQAH